MDYFVDKHSVVRQIWGKSDTILFIFAGAAAEFALNKAVDWLYFTGRLPVDPLGRLFSTVSYAKAIIFSEKQAALRTIDAMTAIHATVETNRAAKIPDWAYRDVLFMLIDYSIRSYEVLERNLTRAEKVEVFQVFNRLGERMKLSGLPETFDHWEKMREEHLHQNMQHSTYTDDLFNQYKKHLGPVRYRILIDTQTLVVPQRVHELLNFKRSPLIRPLLSAYKLSKSFSMDWILKDIILPTKYKQQIRMMGS
jgi:uncharacterized protein (DUF2236 family)